ncbi:UbiH/UbiF family hydroxylase [Bosea sp. SSUT16]|jgi:2-octaprenyl-6-methoxyphenol hydroxylase|uniref:UbiH/UbiF family hydroxylase n=1 Tax=Bosea spartocytisi TaxID=2773451 RepID=A0A927ECI8_9HYPH|nr:UbiH/UbiF family hydroxylase [Bosea spartocytisi]MBD3848793.1 UbiH/UbiF family hydroxylase [Bosea spartocytisi]MCT4471363.1 UbiH/UbiF family hydroxylase [Bosea spartocytisi]
MSMHAGASVDIAIVGAGPVGLAAALALASEGRSVALLGPLATPRDGRTVALLDSSWRLLAELGLQDALLEKAAPLAVMRLVDDSGSLFRQPPVEFRASEIGLEAFGWNIENADLTEVLTETAGQRAGLRLLPGLVRSIEPAADSVRLCGDGFAPLSARLVVGADGRNSQVRAVAGIASRDWRYPQVALTGIFTHARDHREISTEFHTRQGPCTLVPLPGRRSSLVWLLEPEAAEAVAALDDAAFARRVETQVQSLLGAMSVAGPRGRIPMGGLSVDRFAAGRMALIGEAAHVFPPIGAQGLNLGLRDVAALRDAVAERDDPGAEGAMTAYDAARRTDVRLRTGAVDALNRTLLSDLLPADLMRGAGLLALSRIGPLRRFVMRQGLAGGAAR